MFTRHRPGPTNELVLTGNDSVNGNWTYAYDDFGRVATSSKTGQAFEYKYDRFSNRWQQNVTQGSGPGPQYTFDANNHLAGVTYDAAGNMTNDGSHTYTYDAEGRMLTVNPGSAASYVYDASGKRARATLSGTPTDFIYDLAGRVENAVNSSSWLRGEIYAGGMHLATYNNTVNPTMTYFDHQDWLGTVRAHSNAAGVSTQTCTNLAFGDSFACSGTESSPLHYTGEERDTESNLHHFLFRQLSTTQGRWMTPDPAGMAVAYPGQPQSWNRYAYVRNVPTTLADPLGLYWACVTAGGEPECHWYEDDQYDASVGGVSGPGVEPAGGGGDPTGPGAPGGDCKPGEVNCQPPANNCTPGTKGCFNVPQLCANVPNSPPGASATFNANLVNQTTQGMWPATKLSYFDMVFRTGGTFDYKATGGDQYVDYGNWNFGYVCGANYPGLFCQSAAGANRMWRAAGQGSNPFGSGFPFLKSPYGDQSTDNQQIRSGMQAQASGCVQ